MGRFPLAFQVVPGLNIACGIWFLQERPRVGVFIYDVAFMSSSYAMNRLQNTTRCKAVLRKLYGNGSNDEFLELEYREIRETIIAEKTLIVQSWGALLAKPSWPKRLALECGVQTFGQLSGINVCLS